MLSKAFKSVGKTIQPAVASRGFATSTDKPKRVVVTGAAGQISYSILFRLARYSLLSMTYL